MRVRQRAHALRVIWAPSLARRFLRHRVVQAAAAVTVVSWLALGLAAQSEALEHQRSAWGSVTTVLVVTERVEPGELVTGHVDERDLPRALVPAGAADAMTTGSRAKVALFPGEVLLRQRMTDGPHDEATAMPTGTVALTVPIVRLVPFLIEGTKSMPVIWLVAILTSGLAALAIGALSLRTTGVYFIMITLAFGQMFYFFAIRLEL